MKKETKTAIVCVKGMHCQSCDILVKDKFNELENVEKVEADYHTATAKITYTGDLDKKALNKKISKYGYEITDSPSQAKEPFLKRLTEASVLGMILFFLFFFAQELNLIPSFSGAANLTLGAAFILGLVASTSTCMATSGALFMATIGKMGNSKAAIGFNVGRVLSYGAFGFLFGFLGKSLTANSQVEGYLTLFVAIAMIFVGLDMLHLVSFNSFMPQSFTKGLFENLEHRLLKNPSRTSFFLGAITYLLPCGFTQTVQLYALGLANPVQGALLMMAFALGTTPALLAIGYLTTFTKSRYYPMFMKVMGVLVFMIGVSYLNNFLNLRGVNVMSFIDPAKTPVVSAQETVEPQVQLIDGKQVVKMDVTARGYSPNNFTVKQGIPVRWEINGANVFGCQGNLVAPKANLQATLKQGHNVLEFTPKEKGPLNFSCGMGMYKGSFNVI